MPHDDIASNIQYKDGKGKDDFENLIPYIKSLINAGLSELTHWGLMTPYGNIDLGQHWLR